MELMIPIALLKELCGQDVVSTTEITNMKRCSSKAHKLRYKRVVI